MKTKTWKIKRSVYLFPKKWNQDDVLNFVNTDIKVCPFCCKVDVLSNHLNHCSN